MNEKCYVVMKGTVVDVGEYREPRDWTHTLAVAKTKEKAFELIQKYSEEERIPDLGNGTEKAIESNGWRITINNGYETSTFYCIEFNLQ